MFYLKETKIIFEGGLTSSYEDIISNVDDFFDTWDPILQHWHNKYVNNKRDSLEK